MSNSWLAFLNVVANSQVVKIWETSPNGLVGSAGVITFVAITLSGLFYIALSYLSFLVPIYDKALSTISHIFGRAVYAIQRFRHLPLYAHFEHEEQTDSLYATLTIAIAVFAPLVIYNLPYRNIFKKARDIRAHFGAANSQTIVFVILGTSYAISQSIVNFLNGKKIKTSGNWFTSKFPGMNGSTSGAQANPGNTPVTAGGSPVHTGNTPVHTSNTPVPTGNTPVHTGNTPVHTGNTPVHTGNTPVHTGNTPVHTGNTPIHTGNTPVHTGNTPVHTGNTPIATTNVPTINIIPATQVSSAPVSQVNPITQTSPVNTNAPHNPNGSNRQNGPVNTAIRYRSVYACVTAMFWVSVGIVGVAWIYTQVDDRYKVFSDAKSQGIKNNIHSTEYDVSSTSWTVESVHDQTPLGTIISTFFDASTTSVSSAIEIIETVSADERSPGIAEMIKSTHDEQTTSNEASTTLSKGTKAKTPSDETSTKRAKSTKPQSIAAITSTQSSLGFLASLADRARSLIANSNAQTDKVSSTTKKASGKGAASKKTTRASSQSNNAVKRSRSRKLGSGTRGSSVGASSSSTSSPVSSPPSRDGVPKTAPATTSTSPHFAPPPTTAIVSAPSAPSTSDSHFFTAPPAPDPTSSVTWVGRAKRILVPFSAPKVDCTTSATNMALMAIAIVLFTGLVIKVPSLVKPIVPKWIWDPITGLATSTTVIASAIFIGIMYPLTRLIAREYWYNPYFVIFAVLASFRAPKAFIHLISYLFCTRPAEVSSTPTWLPRNVVVHIDAGNSTYNSDFQSNFASILANRPGLIRIAASNNGAFQRVQALTDSLPAAIRGNTPVEVYTTLFGNARAKFMASVGTTTCPIVCFTDTTTTWPRSFLTSALAPFESSFVGMVGTTKVSRRHKQSGLLTNISNFLGLVKIQRQNYENTATYNIDGGVASFSSQCFLIRREIIIAAQFRKEFLSETFAQSRAIIDGASNFMTRYCTKLGWQTVFHAAPEARVLLTEVGTAKEDGSVIKRSFKQLIHDSRIEWRSNLVSLFKDGKCWKAHPWTTYAALINSLVNITILYDPIMFYFLYNSARDTSQHFCGVFYTYMAFKLVKAATVTFSFSAPRPSYAFWQVFEQIFWNIFRWDTLKLVLVIPFGYFHSLVKIHALFTIWDVSEMDDSTIQSATAKGQWPPAPPDPRNPNAGTPHMGQGILLGT